MRILVLGPACSGKSTLAKKLAETFDVELFHLDQHFWKPDWKEPDSKEWENTVKQFADRDNWVMEGNYLPSLTYRLKRADYVIYLEIPIWLCLIRMVKRRIQSIYAPRLDMADGCHENLNWEFTQWIYRFNRDVKPRIDSKIRDHNNVLVIRNSGKIKELFDIIKNSSSESSFKAIKNQTKPPH